MRSFVNSITFTPISPLRALNVLEWVLNIIEHRIYLYQPTVSISSKQSIPSGPLKFVEIKIDGREICV